MAGKTIARTAWDDAQCRLGVHQRARHLIHGAVATYSHDDVGALRLLLIGYDGGMAGILGHSYPIVEFLMVEMFLYKFGYAGLACGARYGVHYEQYRLLVFHRS